MPVCESCYEKDAKRHECFVCAEPICECCASVCETCGEYVCSECLTDWGECVACAMERVQDEIAKKRQQNKALSEAFAVKKEGE